MNALTQIGNLEIKKYPRGMKSVNELKVITAHFEDENEKMTRVVLTSDGDVKFTQEGEIDEVDNNVFVDVETLRRIVKTYDAQKAKNVG